MSFNTTLLSYRDAQGGNKQLAPLLYEKWPHSGDRPEISTISSRLSELVAGKARGAKFFFDDLAVAAVLLEALEVPEADRAGIREEAAAAAAGAPPPRLVVEVSAFAGDDRDTADKLFPLIEAAIPPTLQPVAVIVRETQYRWLPRSIEPPRFTIHRVRDEAVGRATADALSARRGLLWSPNRGTAPIARWAAVQFSGGKLTTYPTDALESFAQKGTLGATQTSFRSLQSFGVQPEPLSPPTDPVRLRKLYDDLQNPRTSGDVGRPGQRVSLADQLEIAAAATAKECTEFDIAATARDVGLTPVRSTDAALASLLDRATRREVGPTLLRIDDHLHAINPTSAPERRNLSIHRVGARPAMITRLLESVVKRTRDDWRNDRFLEDGFEIEEGELSAFRMARATLLHTGVAVAEAPTGLNGIEALATLVDGQAPAARLAVQSAEPDAIVMTRHEFARLSAGQPSGEAGYWLLPPVSRECLVSRADEVLCFTFDRAPPSSAHPLVPVGEAALQNPNAWLDVFDAEQEAMALPDERSFDRESSRGVHRSALLRSSPSTFLGEKAWRLPTPQSVVIPAEHWRHADLHMLLCWTAIQRALHRPDSLKLYDGTDLLSLGAGVFASISARKHGPVNAPLVGSLRVTCRSRSGLLESVVAPVGTFMASTAIGSLVDVGPTLPRGLLITGKGWAIDVSFVGSAVLGGHGTEQVTSAAAAVEG